MHFGSKTSVSKHQGGALLLTLATAFAAQAVGQATAQEANQETAPILLDPIIVQGERQEKSLRETRSSVTVIQTDELERRPGEEINDIINGTPNVNLRSLSESPNIRGVEGGGPGGLANTALGGTLPRVAFIVDDVARPAAVPNSDAASLWDVEQVEVLKGPQTTLRGRSAIGGAVVVKTFDPSFEPEAAAQSVLEFDEFHGPTRIFNGMASTGVFEDRLAVRGTVEYQAGDDPRDIVNTPAGRDDNNLTEFRQTRTRGKLLFTPQGENGPLQILGTVEYQTGRTPQTRATVQSTGFTDGVVREFEDREIDFTTGGLRLFDTRAGTASLNTSYDFDNGMTLRSITSYAMTDYESRDEQPQNFFFRFDEGLINQDLLLEFGEESDHFSGLLGASYTRREQDVRIDNIIPPFVPEGVAFLTADGESETASTFADLRFGVTERLDLLFGGRLLWNRDQRDTASSLTSIPPFNIPPSQTEYDESETVLLPSIGVAYEVTPEQTVLAGARRGWNAGGSAINFFTGEAYEYDSERVWTLETGYRYESDSGRYSLAATAFYNFHDDPQFFLETQPGNRFSIQVVNLPKGESYGLELEGRAAVTSEISLNAGIGLLRTEITESTGANPALEGNRFGKDPDYTFNAGALWRPAAVPGLSLDGRITYIGEADNDFNNTSGQEIGSYALVDLGASYEVGAFEGRVFVKNLFDRTGQTTRVNNFSAVTPPRTFGVALTARF